MVNGASDVVVVDVAVADVSVAVVAVTVVPVVVVSVAVVRVVAVAVVSVAVVAVAVVAVVDVLVVSVAVVAVRVVSVAVVAVTVVSVSVVVVPVAVVAVPVVVVRVVVSAALHTPPMQLHTSPGAHSVQRSPSFTGSCWQPAPPVQVALLHESIKSLQSIGSGTVQNENPNRIVHVELPGSSHEVVEQSTASQGSCGVDVPVVVADVVVVGVVNVVGDVVMVVVVVGVVVVSSGWFPRASCRCSVASAMHPLKTDSASSAKKTGGLCPT